MDISQIATEGSAKSMMTFHEDPHILSAGELPRHSYFIPFANTADPFMPRTSSERFELLNGEWDFLYCESIIDLPDDFAEMKLPDKIPVRSRRYSRRSVQPHI